jgi:hypothetical protein
MSATSEGHVWHQTAGRSGETEYHICWIGVGPVRLLIRASGRVLLRATGIAYLLPRECERHDGSGLSHLCSIRTSLWARRLGRNSESSECGRTDGSVSSRAARRQRSYSHRRTECSSRVPQMRSWLATVFRPGRTAPRRPTCTRCGIGHLTGRCASSLPSSRRQPRNGIAVAGRRSRLKATRRTRGTGQGWSPVRCSATRSTGPWPRHGMSRTL